MGCLPPINWRRISQPSTVVFWGLGKPRGTTFPGGLIRDQLAGNIHIHLDQTGTDQDLWIHFFWMNIYWTSRQTWLTGKSPWPKQRLLGESSIHGSFSIARGYCRRVRVIFWCLGWFASTYCFDSHPCSTYYRCIIQYSTPFCLEIERNVVNQSAIHAPIVPTIGVIQNQTEMEGDHSINEWHWMTSKKTTQTRQLYGQNTGFSKRFHGLF